MLKAGFQESRTTRLEYMVQNPLFTGIAELRKLDFEEEADPELFPHIIHARALEEVTTLDESQLEAGRKLNSLKQWVAVEGGFGTGKTRLIAASLAARNWELSRPRNPRTLTLVVTTTNKSALNVAMALKNLNVGDNFKYVCTKAFYSILTNIGKGEDLLDLEKTRNLFKWWTAEDNKGKGSGKTNASQTHKKRLMQTRVVVMTVRTP